MKNYRLKKWYPSLGSKTKKDHVFGKKVVIEDFKEKYVNQTVPEPKYLDVDEVENNSEFWEEIIEQNYEILSFYFHGKIYEKTGEISDHYLTGKPYNVFRVKGQTGMITNERVETRSFDENFYIHSVKRLSDREIFTIGDRVGATNNFYTGGMFHRGKVSERVSEDWDGEFYDTTVKNFEFAGGRLCIVYNTERAPIGQPIEYVNKLRDKKPKNNYEILSLMFNEDGVLRYKDIDGCFKYERQLGQDGFNNNLNACLNNGWSINSIRRLSDGQILTLGDKIEVRGLGEPTIIEEIAFIEGGDEIEINNFIYLFDIQKADKPLFTTEDGDNIYEGDKIYWQNPYTNNIIGLKLHSKNEITATRKYFSTPEKAKHHIFNSIKVIEA